MNKGNTVFVYDSHINAWAEDCDDLPNRKVLAHVIAQLKSDGFSVQLDPDTLKNFPTLSRDHWLAKKGILECKVTRSGLHIEAEFFTGEFYGRDQYRRLETMPRTMQLACITQVLRVLSSIVGCGYQFLGRGQHDRKPTELTLLAVRDSMRNECLTGLEAFNQQWQSDRLDRADKLMGAELEWLCRYSLLANQHLSEHNIPIGRICEVVASSDVPTEVIVQGGYK